MKLDATRYWIRARLYPAILATAPVIALVLTLVPWSNLHPTQLVGSIGVGVMIYALSIYSRRAGKTLERNLKNEIGPTHTSSMLWHSNDHLHADRKDPIVSFVASKIGQRRPTRDEEKADPARAHAFYDRCATWLRENMRGPEYSILFEENVAYGFQRNLLGLKKFGLMANGLAVLIAASIAFYGYWFADLRNIAGFAFVLVVGVVHAVFFLMLVNKAAVVETSDAYFRQLIGSCEILIGKAEINRSSAKRSPKRNR